MTVVRRRARSRRRPDFAGRDAHGAWSLVEAKGRAATGALRGVRRDALSQVQAVDLCHVDGTPIAVSNRAACVARLGTRPLTVFADDPPPDDVQPTVMIDPRQLLWHYYTAASSRGLTGTSLESGEGDVADMMRPFYIEYLRRRDA